MTEPLSPVNQLIAQRYRIVRELGRGGMGVVYVVEHVRTGGRLALKLLHGRAARDPLAIERFKREAQASARIGSEHVVKVLDADVAPELEGAPFLVMELLDGLDLEKLLARRGRLPAAEVVEHLAQAARALDRSHAMGIVHRDLKPENLFLHRREDGTTLLKIVDFGISKLVGVEGGGDLTDAGMTSTGAVMGTPLYMAPEQARGLVTQISAATDVWAVGLIAIRLLTGEIYWRASTMAALMLQICSEPLYAPTQRWPWLPAAMDPWFARSCARDPALRFRSVGEQVEALALSLGLRAQAFAEPLAAPAAEQGPPPAAAAAAVPEATTTTRVLSLGRTSTPARSRRSRSAVSVIGLAVLALAGLGSAMWFAQGSLGRHEPDDRSASAARASPSAVFPSRATPPLVSSGSASESVADGGPHELGDASASPGTAPMPPPANQRGPSRDPPKGHLPRPPGAFEPTSP